jgi:hypothetical protein
MGLLLAKERSEQALAVIAEPVDRQAMEGAAFEQARVEQYPQVATDPALLAFGNQAEVANASLLDFPENAQEQEPGRIGQGLSASAALLSFSVGQELTTQALGFSSLRPPQTRWLVSHGTTD